MKTEEEIMFDRRVRGMGLTVVGLFICLILFSSISSGKFDSLKHLNHEDDMAECGVESPEFETYQTGNSALGEQLFKANCASCHILGADATGPNLRGARERWIKQSTEDNFYRWIKNSKKVLESGDPYANKLFKDWNQVPMHPQQLSNQEIDEIFIYIN